MSETIILIPARHAASRLPGKPLADIGGEPMIVHVWRRAMESGLGEVFVATDDQRILQAVEKAGGQAVMTGADHQSGSDRIFEALGKIDGEGRARYVLNLQGDLPTLDPALARACIDILKEGEADISTLGVEISGEDEKNNPNVVKIVGSPLAAGRLRALYFTRATAPWGEGPLYHHIGIYGYRRKALERFVSLPQSALERRERLEQLRALENGMVIEAAIVDTAPLGVDTPADLQRARQILAGQQDLNN